MKLERIRELLTLIAGLKPDGAKSVTYTDAPPGSSFGPRVPVNLSIIDVEVEAARSLRSICRALDYAIPLKSVPPQTIASALLRQPQINEQIEANEYARDELSWLYAALRVSYHGLSGCSPYPLPLTEKQIVKARRITSEVSDTPPRENAAVKRHGDVTYRINGTVYHDVMEG